MEMRGLSYKSLPDWLRANLNDTQRFLIICITAGLCCGLVGVAFHLAITHLFDTLFASFKGMGIWAIPAMVLSPAVAGAIVGFLIHGIAPGAAGSGIPQTKVAYHRDFGIIHASEAIWRFIAGTISVGMGNSLGREGPTVHICSAVASKLGRLFGLNQFRIQAMVPVGMAAGISAAFNAPLAAISFAFEELLGTFSSKALGGILVAVVVAAVVERSLLGEHAALHADTTSHHTAWWMLICLVIGPLAGFTGHAFTALLLRLRADFKSWKQIPNWLKPAIGGLGVGLLGVSVMGLSGGHLGVFSIGYDDLNAALNGHLTWHVLLWLLIGKLLATAVCYGAGASGGIFAPTLFIGSMLGSLLGVLLAHSIEVDSTVVAACALLGTGAFFAAVIRCPMTSVLIIFEMTRNYSLILPLMVGNLLAYLIASRLRAVPIYDALLLQDGISLKRLPGYQGEQDWKNLPVSTIMSYHSVCIDGKASAGANLKTIREASTVHHAYPVVAHEGDTSKLLGVVSHRELEVQAASSGETALATSMNVRAAITAFTDTSIREAAQIMIREDVSQLPVVSRKDPQQLLGIITLHDIARQQNFNAESIPR